jgi:hypothetical protein
LSLKRNLHRRLHLDLSSPVEQLLCAMCRVSLCVNPCVMCRVNLCVSPCVMRSVNLCVIFRVIQVLDLQLRVLCPHPLAVHSARRVAQFLRRLAVH